MDRALAGLYTFIIIFFIVFIIDYFVVCKNYLKVLNGKKKRKKNKELIEIEYLKKKFKLKIENLNLKELLIITSLMNSFIISLVCVFILVLNIHIFFKLVIASILIIALIYSLYEIFGRYLVKKGYDK